MENREGKYCYAENDRLELVWEGPFETEAELRAHLGDRWSDVWIGRYGRRMCPIVNYDAILEEIDTNTVLNHDAPEELSIFAFVDVSKTHLVEALSKAIETFFEEHPIMFWPVEAIKEGRKL